MSKVIGYLRCSTSEQGDSRAGLDAQRAAILAEAERRGWDEVQFVQDVASGKSLERPGIQAALEALRRKQADTLVVAKIDRLSRSLLDFASVMDVATRQHWALVALDVGVDTGTMSGRAMASVMAVFSQLEREMIGQRTRDALQAKREAGVRLGRPPEVSPDVERWIRDLRSNGWTLARIADHLNQTGINTARGGKRWYASTVRTVLARSATG